VSLNKQEIQKKIDKSNLHNFRQNVWAHSVSQFM